MTAADAYELENAPWVDWEETERWIMRDADIADEILSDAVTHWRRWLTRDSLVRYHEMWTVVALSGTESEENPTYGVRTPQGLVFEVADTSGVGGDAYTLSALPVPIAVKEHHYATFEIEPVPPWLEEKIGVTEKLLDTVTPFVLHPVQSPPDNAMRDAMERMKCIIDEAAVFINRTLGIADGKA